ncbi:hypothetical protein [Halobacteriovorax sp. JY17]|uniref:hypothetical protein n=1 Tax=Halobacteriovorax sp. JY17 TaxID=2014617 RepID=UPI000C4AE157|nr:hypothetical protein [Halobacteriovorax sp. JY17]PIK14690.1 MAG: hypothetical protein CES88_10150 [Halobacteriovorax sp. JY17]
MFKNSGNMSYYFFVICVISTAAVLITLSIFFIINETFSSNDPSIFEEAFVWQEKHKGVVGITANIANLYKQKMTDRVIEKNSIDIVILGSSTLMGIKSDMFDNYKVFNGAKNGNPLSDSIAKAKYYAKVSDSIKYVIIGFDWTLNLVNREYKDISYKPEGVKQERVDFVVKIKDAVSYQRIKIILSVIYDNILNASKVYQCPTEDGIGTDQFFKADRPRRCHGFRYDGSSTFENYSSLTIKKWEILLKDSLSKYREELFSSKGKVESRYLADLNEIDKALKRRGGKLVILVPPLMPGATRLIYGSSEGVYLTKIIDKLLKYTKRNNIFTFDASRSEEFGCIPEDFLDEHHSFPSCYEKIVKALSID